jgi:two-component system sensor histidine kinase/response regulator
VILEKFKILIVDDIEANVYALQLVLEKNDKLHIVGVNSAFEALSLLDKTPIDLILSDIQMPVMNGLEFVSTLRLRKKTANIPVIFVTAYEGSDSFAEQAKDLGAIDFLVKPIDEVQLLHRIKTYSIFTQREREKSQKILNLEEIIKKEIEESRKKDIQLIKQSKMAALGEMIGAIAHQWRQPLNVLAINIQTLLRSYKKDRCDEEYLKNFVKTNIETISFMSNTIDDFGDFFKLDKKQELFNVNEAIDEVMRILMAQLENHTIAFELKGEGFFIESYKSEFKQVIMNIISNAKDAFIVNKISKAKISVISENGIIQVIDNAGGIPQDIINKIFEPYFSTKEQSMGIGLHISKMIIEDNMKGKLAIQQIKNGSMFVIEFKNTQKNN